MVILLVSAVKIKGSIPDTISTLFYISTTCKDTTTPGKFEEKKGIRILVSSDELTRANHNS